MHIVIFSGGIVTSGHFVTQSLRMSQTVLAADEGAENALKLGIIPQAVIGDFDSLAKKTQTKLKKLGCEFIKANPEKDETDTELAIAYAQKLGATEITIIGGVEGNRLDHIAANVFLLQRSDTHVRLVNGSQLIWSRVGFYTEKIYGVPGDLLSLVPLTAEVTHITTTGLKYPLVQEDLFWQQARGVSNVFLQNTVTVKFQHGVLLFVHTAQSK